MRDNLTLTAQRVLELGARLDCKHAQQNIDDGVHAFCYKGENFKWWYFSHESFPIPVLPMFLPPFRYSFPRNDILQECSVWASCFSPARYWDFPWLFWFCCRPALGVTSGLPPASAAPNLTPIARTIHSSPPTRLREAPVLVVLEGTTTWADDMAVKIIHPISGIARLSRYLLSWGKGDGQRDGRTDILIGLYSPHRRSNCFFSFPSFPRYISS